jgi:glycosyltransferase involved in cell wall biosynthesis
MKNSTNKYSVLGIFTDWSRPNATDISPGAIGWYRIVNPIEKLGGNIVGKFVFKPTAENAQEMKALGDVWFSKLSDNEGVNIFYGAHRDFTKAKLIIDLDDDPITINTDHPEFKALEAKKEMRIKMMQVADHIVCSTEEIADVVKPINSHITVIPNAIDPKIWDVKRNQNQKDKIKIGWMASGSHLTEFPFILPVLHEIVDKYPQVEVHFAGIVMDKIEEERTFHHIGTKNYAEFPQWYADLNIDIAIAPLIDTQFNRCKSNIKWMEAAMLEIPCVCSPTVYEKSVKHGETGYIAPTRGQFVKYLSWLIENPELRKKIGKQAKQEVLNKWTIDKFLPKYIELFNTMNDKKELSVLTAIAGGKDDLIEQKSYPGVEYVAFTDVKSEGWETRKLCDKFAKPVMNAKIHKILSHKYVDTPYIMWIDGNVKLKKDPKELIKLLGDNDFAFFTHPGRNNPYDEADTCVQLQKGNIQEIAEQIKSYASKDFPQVSRLCEMTAFIRKNNKHANEVFEAWWAEICRYSERDQISFPVIFEKEKWSTIPGSVMFDLDYKELPGNEYLTIKRHKL